MVVQPQTIEKLKREIDLVVSPKPTEAQPDLQNKKKIVIDVPHTQGGTCDGYGRS